LLVRRIHDCVFHGCGGRNTAYTGVTPSNISRLSDDSGLPYDLLPIRIGDTVIIRFWWRWPEVRSMDDLV